MTEAPVIKLVSYKMATSAREYKKKREKVKGRAPLVTREEAKRSDKGPAGGASRRNGRGGFGSNTLDESGVSAGWKREVEEEEEEEK